MDDAFNNLADWLWQNGPGVLKAMLDWGWDHAPGMAKAAATLAIGWLVARLFCRFVQGVMDRVGVDATLARFTVNLSYFGAMALVTIAAMESLGVQTTSLLAVVGAAGLAIAFALQGSLANFAAGILLIVFRPFRVGDFVEAAGVTGEVEEIQVFATVLKTPDNKKIVVPNSGITGGTITNYSANRIRRVDLVVGISYGDDIRHAKQVLEGILARDPRVLTEPKPVVAVLELGTSSVNLAVRPWVATSDYWPVYFDLNESIKLEFDSSGVTIPFPQQDVHVHHHTGVQTEADDRPARQAA
jgi:small conductance mechanosensitive channel